ncbi:hypothetical protein M422DRAFT_256351 [Sphaerobolus stellatus SS14]|uniref:Uncharacterized protein n=1 Tax=Sphaerobolus stellatus (strain SS14) TaxID=990650 RepID=A0A0C9VQU8_SPHS4|nr:hypothetical protein M422DRAFT_256351 [Sphaerobolus stellatus SS14]
MSTTDTDLVNEPHPSDSAFRPPPGVRGTSFTPNIIPSLPNESADVAAKDKAAKYKSPSNSSNAAKHLKSLPNTTNELLARFHHQLSKALQPQTSPHSPSPSPSTDLWCTEVNDIPSPQLDPQVITPLTESTSPAVPPVLEASVPAPEASVSAPEASETVVMSSRLPNADL